VAFKRDYFKTLLTAIIQVAVMFITQAVLARALGTEGRGSFAACITFMNVMATLFSFGLDSSNSYYLASRRSSLSSVLGASVYVVCLSALICSAAAYLLIFSGITFFEKAASNDFLLAALCIGPVIFYSFTVSILRGTLRYTSMNLMGIANILLIAIATYILCYELNMGVKGAIAAYLFGAILPVLTILLISRKEIELYSLYKGYKTVPGLLHYGFRAYISYFAQTMNIQLGLLVMGFMLDDVSILGFYSIAIAIVSRIWIIPDSLYQVLMPKLANDKNMDIEGLCKALRIIILVVIAASLFLAAICHPLVLYGLGPEFIPATIAVYILLIGVIFRSASKVVTAYFFAANRPGINSAIKFVGVVINIALLMLMVPAYKLTGAAIATSISYALEAFIMLFYFARITRLSSAKLLIPQLDDVRSGLLVASSITSNKKRALLSEGV